MYQYNYADQTLVEERVAQFRDQTERFLAGELPEEMLQELNQKYSESDRIRDPWNHYGAAVIVALIAGFSLWNRKKTASESEVPAAG